MFRGFVAAITVGFLSLGVAQAQLVRGQIVITAARAAERVEVVLESAEGQVMARTLSDSMGNFEFRTVPAGRYDVLVRLEGYEEARQRVELGREVLDDTGVVSEETSPAGPASASQFGGMASGVAVVTLVLREKLPELNSSAPDSAADWSRRYPKKALDEYEKAQKDYRNGDLAGAAERFAAVLKLAPDFYYAHNDLGTIYQKMKRYREAEKEYNLARELNPQFVQALISLGSLYLQEAEASVNQESFVVGRILDEALDVLEPAAALDPRNPTVHYLLGTAYYKSTFNEEAELHLQLSLEIDPRMGGARLMLANVYMREQKWPQALDALDTYLLQNPDSADLAQVHEIRLKVLDNIDTARQ